MPAVDHLGQSGRPKTAMFVPFLGNFLFGKCKTKWDKARYENEVMEYWSSGLMECCLTRNTLFHHSNIPILHYSTTPTSSHVFQSFSRRLFSLARRLGFGELL